MADNPIIRQIPRDKLYQVFGTLELVKLFEDILRAVGETLPENTEEVQAELDAHIDDATNAHAASAISNIPAGGISAADVQGALNELDTEKATVAALNAHITDATDAHAASAIANTPSGGITATDVQAALNELDTAKQPLDATLTALGALAAAADKVPYFTGVDTAALADFTAYARTLVAATDAAAARTVLALGTIATQDANAVAITGGSVALASGTLGYATGNGGTVTQATSKSTGVTLNEPSGEITMNAAALAADTAVSFTLTNSTIAAGDRLILNHMSTGTFGAYHLDARAAAGSAAIVVRNLTAVSLGEPIVIGFTVIKSALA